MIRADDVDDDDDVGSGVDEDAAQGLRHYDYCHLF